MGSTKKELKEIIAAAEAQEWRVELTKKGHYKFFAPDGKTIVTDGGHAERPKGSDKLGGEAATPRVSVEGTMSMEYRITITVAEHGFEEACERLLEAFLATHPEAGPVVEADTSAHTMTVTFCVDAEDPQAAVEPASGIFADALADSGLEMTPVLSAAIDAVEASADLERELQPA